MKLKKLTSIALALIITAGNASIGFAATDNPANIEINDISIAPDEKV